MRSPCHPSCTLSGAEPSRPSRDPQLQTRSGSKPTPDAIGGWLTAKHADRTVQGLLAEALNDLFSKYNVPQTADLQK